MLTHHAYLLTGGKDDAKSALEKYFFDILEIKVSGNPDVVYIHEDVFGVDSARDLLRIQQSKPLVGSKKMVIASAYSVTREAQNAMLKLFEEPASHAHLFLIVPSISILIPTLISRLAVFEYEKMGESSEIDVKKFITGTLPERLKMIEKFLKENKDDKSLRAKTKVFFDAIEKSLSSSPKKNTDELEAFYKIQNFTLDVSSSSKMLLETLAATLPC